MNFRKKVPPPRRVKILHLIGDESYFANLIPESVHDVIEPPQGHKNDDQGVWVQGDGERVKVLIGEYTIVE